MSTESRRDQLRSQMDLILKGGRVARFHTKALVKEETVAAHSYLVAWLVTVAMYPLTPSANLLLACLAHDMPEYALGDMPSPTKKLVPGLREEFRRMEAVLFREHGLPDYESEITEEEGTLLKFADNMAGYLKCLYELQLGNSLLLHTAQRYRHYILESLDQPGHPFAVSCRALLDVFPIPTNKEAPHV